jgi:hypothetical protein
MAAALTQSTFESIEHEIIRKHSTSFGQNSQEVRSKFFYWEGPYKEVNIEEEFIYENMRHICKKYIQPHIQAPRVLLPDDCIVIHIRSGDVFDRRVSNPCNYVPNPLYFYLQLIEGFNQAIVVTEGDNHNPILDELRKNSKVTIQSKSVAEDFGTLLSAKHLANSGVGTFGIAAALCSDNIETFYCTDVSISEHLNYKMLLGTDVTVSLMPLDDYINVGEWTNSEEQRRFILEYDSVS